MDDKQCILIIVGATKNSIKETIVLEGGFRESGLSWTQLLLDLKNIDMAKGPKLAVGDGSLGFWKARGKTYGNIRWQRCWVYKTANVLKKLAK